MTDEDQIIEEDQEIDLHDDDDEIMEMKGHDPKNAEAQSVAAVDAAGDATGSAPKRKMAGGTAGDNTTKDPMPKMTKAGMINAMYKDMNKMGKSQLQNMMKQHSGMMQKNAYHMNSTTEDDFDGEALSEYKVDFNVDLNALVESEATLSDDFQARVVRIFEAANKSKLSEEIDRLEEKYNEELTAEIDSTKENLVEKVDSYLNYVVEGWMEENKLAVQTGLRTEIAEKFMNNLKELFTESYIDVPESRVDLVDELAETVDDLEKKLNDTTGDAIAMAEELEGYKRDAVIREASRDLAETQVEKLKSLVEDVDFDDEETFAKKVATVKASYFTKTSQVNESADFDQVDESDDIVEASGSMAQYLTALKKTQQ